MLIQWRKLAAVHWFETEYEAFIVDNFKLYMHHFTSITFSLLHANPECKIGYTLIYF